MLRGAFGTKHGSKHKQIFTSFSSSARAVSEQFQSSHGHLQKVRNTVAHVSLEAQASKIAAIQPDGVQYLLLELRWDETHVELTVPESPLAPGLPSASTISGFFPLVMLKGSLVWKVDGLPERREPLVLAPVVLREPCCAEGCQA